MGPPASDGRARDGARRVFSSLPQALVPRHRPGPSATAALAVVRLLMYTRRAARPADARGPRARCGSRRARVASPRAAVECCASAAGSAGGFAVVGGSGRREVVVRRATARRARPASAAASRLGRRRARARSCASSRRTGSEGDRVRRTMFAATMTAPTGWIARYAVHDDETTRRKETKTTRGGETTTRETTTTRRVRRRRVEGRRGPRRR